MHPSFPYHLLRLKNHLFILSGNFTSQGLDQIGISTQERWWGVSHLYPSIRTLLFYKCILQILSALSKHSSPAPLRGYSDVFNYSRNALSVLLGLSSWPQVTVLFYYYDFTLQSRWVLDLVNTILKNLDKLILLISLAVPNLPSNSHHHGSVIICVT